MSQVREENGQAAARTVGWSGLFRAAFKSSRNPMVLLDEERRQVDVNGAYLKLLGYRRADVLGHPVWEIVKGGPVATPEEWHALIDLGQFSGSGELVSADGNTVNVQIGGKTEVITGRQLVLFVAVSTSRIGRHFRRDVSDDSKLGELTDRELEIVRLVAQGESGPEIAAELHIAHNTVRTHVRNAMTKLGARSRAHLVAKALGEGLIL